MSRISNLQFIIFINKLYLMIAQKRFFGKSVKAHHPKASRYDQENDNISLLVSFQSNILNPYARKRSQQPQLTQISNTFNDFVNRQFLLNKNNRAISIRDKKCQFVSLERNNQNVKSKLSQSLQSENIQQSTCFENKKQSRILHERPKTSLSQETHNKDESSIKKCNVIFDLYNEFPASEERISTSRALSKYSKVQRNIPNNRFKVKKDKNYTPAYLSARKIVFNVKERKQKSNISQYFKTNEHCKRRFSKNIKPSQGEEFQLRGWDYD